MPYYTIEQLNNTEIHFIVGSGRSGTTLMTTIFNANPEVICIPEARLVMAFNQKYSDTTAMPEHFSTDLSNYVSTILDIKKQTDERLWLADFDTDMYLHFDKQQLPQHNYANVCKQLLINITLPNRSNQQVRTIVDKNPEYTFFIEPLLKIFPKAKFLVAVRDYRSVVLSQRESEARAGLGDVAFHAFLWDKYNQEVLRMKKRYPNQLMLIPYEKMVQDTEQTLRDACSFLNINFDADMLTPYKKVQAHQRSTDTSNRDQKVLGDLQKPINTSRIEAWKNRLTTQEVALIETLCAQTGTQLGYQATQQLSFVDKCKLILPKIPNLAFAVIAYTIFLKYYYSIPLSLRLQMIKRLRLSR